MFVAVLFFSTRKKTPQNAHRTYSDSEDEKIWYLVCAKKYCIAISSYLLTPIVCVSNHHQYAIDVI